MNERISLLKTVIEMRDGFREAMKNLALYPWDYVGEPAIITSANIKDVLSRYLNEDLKLQDIYDWAETLEIREDVDYPEEDKAVLLEIMHELANPILQGELNADKARALIKTISI